MGLNVGSAAFVVSVDSEVSEGLGDESKYGSEEEGEYCEFLDHFDFPF